MTGIAFSCACGETRWNVPTRRDAARLVCYCKDCQAFANHLDADRVMSDHGGTPLVQCSPDGVSFVKGREHIRLMQLSPKGLYRWYAGCCNTPVANGLANAKMAFISFMTANTKTPDAFGPILCHANTTSATGGSLKDYGLPKMVASFSKRAVTGRMTGAWKRNPFFNHPELTPIAQPHIISLAERQAATSKGSA